MFAEMAEDINSLGDGMQAGRCRTRSARNAWKSELITNVSHDLKTPLTSILNYSDLLGKMDLTPEEANDYARIIYQKGLRLKNLTSDLFDISKVQSGAEQIISERLDACTLARQALAEQDKAVQESGLTVKAAIPERELPIWAVRTKAVPCAGESHRQLREICAQGHARVPLCCRGERSGHY